MVNSSGEKCEPVIVIENLDLSICQRVCVFNALVFGTR